MHFFLSFLVTSLLLIYVYMYSMQQSVAFKILRTRLKTVPSNNYSSGQLRRSPSQQIQDDSNRHEDVGNTINFAHRMQQFGQMRHQHRMYAKSGRQPSNSPSLQLTQV